MKNFKKFLSALLVFIFVFLLIPVHSISAMEKNLKAQVEESNIVSSVVTPVPLTEEEIRRFNEFVLLDEDGNFYIKSNAGKYLNSADLKKLESNLNYANSIVQTLKNNTQIHVNLENNYTLDNSNKITTNKIILTSQSTYHEGVTKVETYWWGARIYISKSTANNLGSLYTLGGIFTAAQPVASAIISAMGWAGQTVPGGFSFSLTWPQLTPLMGGVNLPNIATVLATFAWQ